MHAVTANFCAVATAQVGFVIAGPAARGSTSLASASAVTGRQCLRPGSPGNPVAACISTLQTSDSTNRLWASIRADWPSPLLPRSGAVRTRQRRRPTATWGPSALPVLPLGYPSRAVVVRASQTGSTDTCCENDVGGCWPSPFGASVVLPRHHHVSTPSSS